MATECVWRFPHLYGIGTSHRNADVVVHPPEFMIGQAPHCSLILRHDIVTGLHCIIKYEEARWFITDFSFEGTYVNGNKITRGVAVPLDEGFVIKLGPYHNFIYVFSFRDKVDLEPVLSRLALRMQGGEGSNIFGPVCIPTSQESTIPVNRSEHQPNIPQNASQVNSGILPKTAGPSSSTNGSCPSGTASTTRADPRLHDPSGNKRAPEQNMTFNHENQSSSSNGPSSVSGESGVKKRRYSYVNSAGNNVTHEVEERNGSFTEVTMETGASGSFSSKNTFYTPKNCSPGSSSGPSGSARHVNHPTIQNDRLSGVSNKVPPSTNATVETNLRKEIVELHKRIIQYQAKDSHLVRVNHELLSQLQETRLIYERKLQTIEETKHNTGPQSSQASSSAGLIDGAGNGLNPNLSSETPSFAANHSMAEEVTGMENGQQTRNGTPELDSVKEELNRMKAEHAVTEKELNRMKAEHAVTEKELNRMKAEHAVTEKELNRMKGEHAVTEKELNRMKGEHAVTEKERNRMKAEHAVTEKELNRMKGEHAVTEKELNRMKGEHAVTEKELNRMKGEHAVTEKELNRMKGEHAVTEKELNRMKSKHAVTEKELNRMKAKHAATEKKLNRMKAKHAVTEKERKRMKAERAVTEKERNRMKAEHAVTEKELNRMKSKHAVTEKELNRMKAEHAVTEKERNRMKAEHAVTEKELNRMKAEHAVTEKELNRMKAEHAVTEKELNRMKAEHAVTEKELTETKELKNSLSIQLQERDEHVKELKKEILELNEVKECLNSCLKSSEEKLENVYSLVENDMACSICNEIFVTPITLNCCHTFCEFCIVEWKKKKHDCPMCRTPIVTQSRSIPMEHFIDKITETKEDIKRHRLELISLRESASEETNVEGDNESEIQELPFTDESNSGDDIRTGVAPTGVVPQPEVFPQAGFIEGVLISQEMVYIPW